MTRPPSTTSPARRYATWARLLTFLLLVPLTSWGCQSHLSSGILAFDEARYPDAGDELRRVEPTDLNAESRTRWALYLGLSELALGNVARASCALQRARRDLAATPLALTIAERGRLDAAWTSLGRSPGVPLISLDRCPR